MLPQGNLAPHMKAVSNLFGESSRARVRRLASEGSWILGGQVASAAGSLALVRLITAHLNPAEYGRMSLGITLGTLICQMAFSGSWQGIVRYYTVAAEKGETRPFFAAAARSMGYGTLVALAAGVLLVFGLRESGQAGWSRLTVLALLFSLLANYNTTLSAVQNAARQRRTVAFHGSLDGWLKVLFTALLFGALGSTGEVVLLGYLASLAVVLASQSLFVRQLVAPPTLTESDAGAWLRRIWLYSKPFVFFTLFTWIQSSCDRWALQFQGLTRDVGLYSVLIQLGYTPIATATGVLAALIGPIFYQRSGDALDPARNSNVHRLAWQLTNSALCLTAAACVVAFLLHTMIFRYLVAPEYRSASHLLPWVTLAGGLFSAGQILALKLMSDMNTQALTGPKIVTAIVGTVLSFAGARIAGLNGVVFAFVVFALLHFTWLGWISKLPPDAGVVTPSVNAA
jgi:O-antigen/teichoic acid export membrane protein